MAPLVPKRAAIADMSIHATLQWPSLHTSQPVHRTLVDGPLFCLPAFQHPGEGQFLLNPQTPEPTCDCSGDVYNCDDFATQFEAQQCFDSCWVMTGEDLHKLDADANTPAAFSPSSWGFRIFPIGPG